MQGVTNKAQMLLTINCGFNWQNKITYFAQLSHNVKRELFFRILWGKVRPSYYYDALKSREQDIMSIDQISFHNDGTLHVRHFSAGKKEEKMHHTKCKIPFLSCRKMLWSVFNSINL